MAGFVYRTSEEALRKLKDGTLKLLVFVADEYKVRKFVVLMRSVIPALWPLRGVGLDLYA